MFMTIFGNKLFVFFSILIFIINISGANAAYCNSQKKKAVAGLYCNALTTHECPAGCFCTGGGNFTWGVGDVEKGCKNRWSKITTELNSKGVYLCPEGQTSNAGAKSVKDCFVATAEEEKRCVPGCFCVNDGKMPKGWQTKNICGYSSSYRIPCGDEDISLAFGRNEDGMYTGTIACSRKLNNATYYFDEFSGVYEGKTGRYGFVGNDLITMPSSIKALYDYGNAGIYTCPVSHPASDVGAKSPKDCYKYDKNGKKVYFSVKQSNPYEINGVGVLVSNLQFALDSVTKITLGNTDANVVIRLTQELQNALNKINEIVSKL